MSQQEILDIVALVENNPLTKLSSDYGSKIVQKLQQHFTTQDQQFYVSHLYCYLNYDPNKDFPIDMNGVWKWLDYNRINDCIRVLTKNFKENIDYKIEKFALQDGKAKIEPVGEPEKTEKRGGHNKEQILLTVNCFKKLCLKSRTEKADEIHDYYIKLEEIMHELVVEQTQDLQQKLLINSKQRELNITANFGKKPVVYIGFAEDNILKFGETSDVQKRLYQHRMDIRSDFMYEYVYETIYNLELEKLIKKHVLIKPRIISRKYNSSQIQKEFIFLSPNFTIKHLERCGF